MGSDQSTHIGTSVRTGLRRGKSVPEYKLEDGSQDCRESSKEGNISPETSICSDSDLPYISYTVNRPIGDSPKKKPMRKLSRGKTLPPGSLSLLNKNLIKKQPSRSSTEHNIVVVKEAAPSPNKYDDPDLKKLKEIPMFLPIMRATINSPAARDPEVLEKLDSVALHNLCRLYQIHMNKCATEISSEQNKLTTRISQIDKDTTRIMYLFGDTQKIFDKYAENLIIVNEMSDQLERSVVLLDNCIQILKYLNDALPDDKKLEPFDSS